MSRWAHDLVQNPVRLKRAITKARRRPFPSQWLDVVEALSNHKPATLPERIRVHHHVDEAALAHTHLDLVEITFSKMDAELLRIVASKQVIVKFPIQHVQTQSHDKFMILLESYVEVVSWNTPTHAPNIHTWQLPTTLLGSGGAPEAVKPWIVDDESRDVPRLSGVRLHRW